jgi:Ycf66 protein N-terminus
MVNFGLNSASLLGIILAVAGAGLYFLRSVRPELSRDQDIAFTAIGIICGFILIFQGWRLDPILQFGQLLLSGSVIFFAYENIKLRGITTEQAKGKTKIVDDERPVSRRYKAEIEDREYIDERPRNSRRIRGDEERPSDDRDDRDERPRRRSATRQLSEDRSIEAAPRRRRREAPDRSASTSLARRPTEDRWDSEDDWNEAEPVRTRRALPDAESNQSERRSTSRRDDAPPDRDRRSEESDRISEDIAPTPRRRPRSEARPTRGDSVTGRAERQRPVRSEFSNGEGTTANYVDYEPIVDPDNESLDPPSGLPPSGVEPIVFPDRY